MQNTLQTKIQSVRYGAKWVEFTYTDGEVIGYSYESYLVMKPTERAYFEAKAPELYARFKAYAAEDYNEQVA